MNSLMYHSYIMKYSIWLASQYFKDRPLHKMLLSCILFEKIMYSNDKFYYKANDSGIIPLRKLVDQYKFSLSIGNVECYLKMLTEQMPDIKFVQSEVNSMISDIDNFVSTISTLENDEIIRRFVLNEI